MIPCSPTLALHPSSDASQCFTTEDLRSMCPLEVHALIRSPRSPRLRDIFDRRNQLLQGGSSIAEEHRSLRVEVQRIIYAGEARPHAALQDDNLSGVVDVQNRHAVDLTARIISSPRI